MAEVIYDDGADLGLIASKKVAVIGYGSQGHAHALNLKDSGVDVIVGLRPGSSSWEKAEAAGLEVADIPEATAAADVVMILTPDQVQRFVYAEQIAPNLKEGAALFFSHGFNIRYGYIDPGEGHDVCMVAPKGPGHTVRRQYLDGRGVPAIVAVEQDAPGVDLARGHHRVGGHVAHGRARRRDAVPRPGRTGRSPLSGPGAGGNDVS